MREGNGDHTARDADIAEVFVASSTVSDPLMAQSAMEGEGTFPQAASPDIGQDGKREVVAVDHCRNVPFAEAEPQVMEDWQVHGEIRNCVRVHSPSVGLPGRAGLSGAIPCCEA